MISRSFSTVFAIILTKILVEELRKEISYKGVEFSDFYFTNRATVV